MANHKSSIKRIRQTETRRLRNRYYAKTARNAVRNLRKMTDAAEAAAKLVVVTKMLDKLAAKKHISKNKAANLKSKLALHVNKLGKYVLTIRLTIQQRRPIGVALLIFLKDFKDLRVLKAFAGIHKEQPELANVNSFSYLCSLFLR